MLHFKYIFIIKLPLPSIDRPGLSSSPVNCLEGISTPFILRFPYTLNHADVKVCGEETWIMKRALLFLLTGALAATLAACSGTAKSGDTPLFADVTTTK